MYLADFFDYKNRLMSDLLTNEDIVRLIDDDEEFLLQNADQLVYKNVFPYEYIPETDAHGTTYICMDVDVQAQTRRDNSKLLYSPILYVWVFSHRSKLRLPEGGVRTDKLCSEIAKAIDGSMYYGIGELELSSVRRFAPVTDYQGKQLTFTMKEFMRFYNGKKDIPVNRKRDV